MTHRVVAGARIPCPFCEGDFCVVSDYEGRPSGLAHSMPPCGHFLGKDPTQFIQAVNAATAAELN